MAGTARLAPVAAAAARNSRRVTLIDSLGGMDKGYRAEHYILYSLASSTVAGAGARARPPPAMPTPNYQSGHDEA